MPNRTITQVPAVMANIDKLVFERVGAQFVVKADYLVVDLLGTAIGHIRTLEVTLPQSDRDAIRNIVRDTILPAINIAEGT